MYQAIYRAICFKRYVSSNTHQTIIIKQNVSNNKYQNKKYQPICIKQYVSNKYIYQAIYDKQGRINYLTISTSIYDYWQHQLSNYIDKHMTIGRINYLNYIDKHMITV